MSEQPPPPAADPPGPGDAASTGDPPTTDTASTGDAANMLPANSAMRIEPMRLAMNASHCVARPFVATLATIYITWEAVSAGSRRVRPADIP